jgi:hypothetical protein
LWWPDLGSGSGPNAINNTAFILEILRSRLSEDAEIQAYFIDLPGNDFNNLFQLLSQNFKADNVYAAGVPGSYTDRLFARSSVNVFFSSLCLHWLSKLPDEVLDKESPAYNRDSVHCMGSNPAVGKAYSEQAARDLRSFL